MVVQMPYDNLNGLVGKLVGNGVADRLDDVNGEVAGNPQVVVVQMLQRRTHHRFDVGEHGPAADLLQDCLGVVLQFLNVQGGDSVRAVAFFRNSASARAVIKDNDKYPNVTSNPRVTGVTNIVTAISLKLEQYEK